MTKNSSRTYSLQPQGIAQHVATWFIELLHCRIDGPEHELKHQLPEKSRHMTFHPPICQFLQGEMWTFSAFCCVHCSFLSGWVEPPQKNHLGADSMALCRHRVSKRKQFKPPHILPARCLTESSQMQCPLLYVLGTSGKRDQLTIGRLFYESNSSWQQTR